MTSVLVVMSESPPFGPSRTPRRSLFVSSLTPSTREVQIFIHPSSVQEARWKLIELCVLSRSKEASCK